MNMLDCWIKEPRDHKNCFSKTTCGGYVGSAVDWEWQIAENRLLWRKLYDCTAFHFHAINKDTNLGHTPHITRQKKACIFVSHKTNETGKRLVSRFVESVIPFSFNGKKGTEFPCLKSAGSFSILGHYNCVRMTNSSSLHCLSFITYFFLFSEYTIWLQNVTTLKTCEGLK